MTIEDALHPDLFATWLDTYPTMAIGIPGQPAACPIAIYLRETLSLDAITVTRTEIKSQGTTIPLPAWATHFVKTVDAQTAALTGLEAQNVLALALDRAKQAPTNHARAKAIPAFLRRLSPSLA